MALSAPRVLFGQDASDFAGAYFGLEGGAVSYNTQITFDGVDDPAGRGGLGYGAFVGFNLVENRLLLGAELVIHRAPDPDPYTFDPQVIGFFEMDVVQNASIGLDVRGGLLLTKKILAYGSLGPSRAQQTVRIDGVSLESFATGAEPETFIAMQVGAGLEWAFHRRFGIRTSIRKSKGVDLSAEDFGTIPRDASLSRLDVEPSQLHFFTSMVIRFN